MHRILITGLILLVLLAGAWLSPGPVYGALAGQKLKLNSSGVAYEVHADMQNNLFISDFSAHEIWRVASNGQGSTAYSISSAPYDANPDNQNGVWWANGQSLNRLNLSTLEIETWDTSPAHSTWFWGLAVDSQGGVWLSDSGTSSIAFHFTYDSNSDYPLCGYAIPSNGQGFYPAVSGTTFWLGDVVNARLLRLDISGNTPRWTWWTLPPGSKPNQVSVDASSSIWYVDSELNQLGQLDLSHNKLRIYKLPDGQSSPQMLSTANGKIWYTVQYPGLIGSLDPNQVALTEPSFSNSGEDAKFSCVTLMAPAQDWATQQTSSSNWTSTDFTLTSPKNGWGVYQTGSSINPFGIATVNFGFAIDQTHQELLRFPLDSSTPPSPTPHPLGDKKTFIPMVQR